MQYTRIFELGRLVSAVLVGLAVCLATVSDAEAGKRNKRQVSARAKAHRVVSRSDDLVGSPRYAAIVIDDKTGKVLYAKNADAPRHPASLTKMMTLYLLFEDMQKRKVSLSTRLSVSAKASSQAPTKLGLRPGQTIAVEDAIRSLVTKSANDAAVAIAENLGGSESAFARRMTSTARRLGMRGTTFYNASGLPNAAQYTTARDMVILGRALQERFPVQYRYFATRSFAWGNSVHPNHNKLLFRLEGVDGIKTGYTNASGFNLVSSYRHDGRHLVAAVLGGASGRARDDHMARLLTSTLSQASSGSKISSVFKENGTRVADTDDGGEDGPRLAALPIPAPPRVAEAPMARPQPARAEEPMAMMSATSAPLAIVPTRVSYRPRIAASDIVPIQPPEREVSRSAQSGAAVAMARAVLLPESGRPMQPIVTPPTRVAAIAPVAIPVQAPTPRPVEKISLANATISTREVAATTGTLPRHKAEDPVPVARGTPQRAGWLVQIGAYDSEKAARAALDKAKSKSGSALGRVDAFTEPVGGGSGRLWRARFAGFNDQKGADAACKALKRKDFACLALRQ